MTPKTMTPPQVKDAMKISEKIPFPTEANAMFDVIDILQKKWAEEKKR